MNRRPAFVTSLLVIGGLATVAAPATAGGGCHRGYEEGQTEEQGGTTVEMTFNCFGPTILRVEPGTEVTFVNRDQVVHQVDGVGWSSESLTGGEVATRRFDESGTYPFSCPLHPGMHGAVVVGDGRGGGRVVEVTPVTAVVSAAGPAAAPVPALTRPQSDHSGGPGGRTGIAVAVGMGVAGTAFSAGRAVGRRRAGAA